MTEVEFLHKALHSYENVQCNTMDEFNEDLNKILQIRKALSRYTANGEISSRLVLNYIVLLFNVFGSNALDLILYKIPREQYSMLFPFLIFLDRMPLEVINKENIELDAKIIEELRKI